MENVGGYAPELVFSSGVKLGVSALLPNTCTGSVNGPSNPDGQCILGGRLVGNVCVATPIFVQNMVPYTTGRVAGENYDALKGIYSKTTHLNRDWGVFSPAQITRERRNLISSS
jgi:hypothetical protein